jgi:acyl-CoA reductase-like NAD-dependent aldehyde dehydrogenase
MMEAGSIIGGRCVGPTAGRFFESVNPATGRVLARVHDASVDHLERAVASACDAFEDWRRLPAGERAAHLAAVAEILEERAAGLAPVETADTGMTIRMTAGGHLPRSIAHFRHFAQEATRIAGDALPLDDAYLSVVERVPLGVVGIITPWNAPLAVMSINVAAALAAGNTCVVKPSERSPVSATLLATAALEAGLPPGVLNVVQGHGAGIGTALVEHPDVPGICFVGGTATGRDVMERAGRRLKRATLELGGKSPTVVLADADLDSAVDGALLSVFSSNGEVCTAGSRIIVEEPLHERFTEAFVARARAIAVGDPMLAGTEMGPLIDAAHRQRVQDLVAAGIRDGARLACGGAPPPDLPVGYYLSPTVLVGVDNSMRVAREEIFGPVACILRARDAEQAIDISNDTEYGLSATLWTADTGRGLALSRRLRAGTVAVNSTVVRDIRAPFGGMGCSGIGRVGGRWSIEQYTEVKTTTLRMEGLPLPRLGAGDGRRDRE